METGPHDKTGTIGSDATRYDKLPANYLAFIQLASIGLWLRVNESKPTRRDCVLLSSKAITFSQANGVRGRYGLPP
jgi:hypothetical protein